MVDPAEVAGSASVSPAEEGQSLERLWIEFKNLGGPFQRSFKAALLLSHAQESLEV